MKTPLTLIIMDGYGLSSSPEGNAIAAANKPNLDRLFSRFPCCSLKCSGLDVGLPEGQMGNSEVGHTNIGAGRIVYQDLTRITRDIKTGDFFKNTVLTDAVAHCKEAGSALHLIGLLSDGGVHSHNTHLWALLTLAARCGLSRVYIHPILDGRDTPPESGLQFIRECVDKTREIGVGRIATVMGRYYAMDRDNRWERVHEAWRAMVLGEGAESPDPAAAVAASYAEGITDEFMRPAVCCREGRIGPEDSVIFFNFRPDRARELTRALVDPDFSGFDRVDRFFPLHYVCFTQYDALMPHVSVAFPPESLSNILGEYLSGLGFTQLRIAETEKYAHVTFFLNGGREASFSGEDRALIPSPQVATYDLQPEMSAFAVTEEACRRINSGLYDVIILNFANCDMVGHTGVFDAAVRAVETVDECVGRVVAEAEKNGGMVLITADHGNAEQMLDADGHTPFTAHTTNPVPFCLVGADVQLRDGRLSDIAPTLLDLMGLDLPKEMTGSSLIV